jgi:hypothetical protein
MRKETTLFGFLEDEEGTRMAMQFALQLVGLAASPIILVLQRLLKYVYLANEVTYKAIEKCAAPAKSAGFDSIEGLCKIVTDASVEGTPTQQVMDALDPYQYSGVLQLVEWLEKPGLFPKYSTLAWAFDVAWNAPQFYVDYYLFGKVKELPPTR